MASPSSGAWEAIDTPQSVGEHKNVNLRDGEDEHSGSERAPLPRERRDRGSRRGNGGGYVLVGLISEDFLPSSSRKTPIQTSVRNRPSPSE